MDLEKIYAEMNMRIDKRLKADPQLQALQKRQIDLGKRINNAMIASQNRIGQVVAEETKKTFKLIRRG